VRFAAALFAATLLAACTGDRSTPPASDLPASVLGVVWKEDGESFVARLHPRSLEPLPGPRAPLGPSGGPSALSPDGSLAAFAGVNVVRIVDLDHMRVVGDIRLRGDFGAVAWPEPRRILLATGFNWETGVDTVVVDPVARRVVARRSLGGSLQSFSRTGDGLVLLLGPRSGIGPARLASFPAREQIRVVRLERVAAGFEQDELEGGFLVDRYRTPGLAVDLTGDRAFVVTADEVVADIDLRTYDVGYHRLEEATSLLGRLRNWLEPPAETKGASDGSLRTAVWVGEGQLAVSGWDDHASFDDEGNQTQSSTPAGAALVDTRTWSKRTLGSDASAASVAGDLLLVYGSVWNPEAGDFKGTGLNVFDPSGKRRFRLFRSRPVGNVQVVGRLAYVSFDDVSCLGRIVDLRSGRVLRGRDLDVLCDRSLLLSAGG
jgi:hypothetical protein